MGGRGGGQEGWGGRGGGVRRGTHDLSVDKGHKCHHLSSVSMELTCPLISGSQRKTMRAVLEPRLQCEW